MTRRRRSAGRCPRRGYTLVEMVVASLLATLLGILLASAMATFGRPALEVEARARIAQEAILAAESLARDLSGYSPDLYRYQEDPLSEDLPPLPGDQGTLRAGAFLAWMAPDDSSLSLCFDSETTPNGLPQWNAPDRVVSYTMQDGRLVRTDETAETATTIASHVVGFVVIPDPDDTERMRIEITLSYRHFTGTYVLIGVKPPKPS